METIFDKIHRMMNEQLPKIYWEDVGIGAYEFWGAKGFDVRYELSWDEIKEHKIEVELDEHIVIEQILQEIFELSFDAYDEKSDEYLVLYPHIQELSCLVNKTNKLIIVYNWQDYPAIN